jgi:hypothetical protein
MTGAFNWNAGTYDQPVTYLQTSSGASFTAGDPNGGSAQLGFGGEIDIYGQGNILANTTMQFAPANANGSGGFDDGYLYIDTAADLYLADNVLLSVNSQATNSYNTVSNYGTLIKTGTGASKIAVELDNDGLVDVRGGSLELAGTVANYSYNNATIAADGGSIKIDSFYSFSAGTETIAANSQLEFVGAAKEKVSFLAASGALKLDASQSFTGTITGLTGQDTIDLGDIAFSANTAASYVGTAAGGTLTVTDGTHTSKIKLTGDFTKASFSLASDGATGTDMRNDLTFTGLSNGNAIDGTSATVALANGTGVTSLSYQWLEYNTTAKAWQNVANATGASFTPAESDEGEQLEVQLSYTDANNGPQTRVAGAGTVGDPAPSVTVGISGTATEGQPLTASATVTDTDSAKGSVAGYLWQTNAGTVASPIWTNASNYTYITGFTKTNTIKTGLIKEMPTGIFHPANGFGERFDIISDANGRNFYDGFGGNGSALTINVSIPNVTDVYTLMNAYGPPSGSNGATVQFIGSQGATQTLTLVNGTDIRDFYQGGFANSINGTTTQNAFTVANVEDAAGSGNVNTGATGTYVVDEQDFHLAAAFATQTLTQS